MHRLPITLRKLIRKSGPFRSLLRSAYRSWLYLTARVMGKLRQERFEAIMVDPNRITHTVSTTDKTLTGSGVVHFGTVSGGDWDLDGVLVSEHGDVFSILNQRISAQISFGQIPEFQAHLDEIGRGAIVDSCATAAEYYARWQAIEKLYQRIKHDGYRTQADLGSDNHLDEVRVQVGRSGDLLFEEGLHRLAIAQHLGLDQIPVIITRRHQEWAALRHDIIKIALQRGFIHQPFDHPDLDGIARQYGKDKEGGSMYGHERWQYIADSLPVSTGTVLDIGPYFGYFTHRFEEAGFECYAVEPDKDNLSVLYRYRRMRRRRFTVWEASLFDIPRFDYDIVLALNIFHHLVRNQADHERLVEFLGQLRCRAIYFEPARSPGANPYRDYTDEAFVEFVIEHSLMRNARLLGRAKEGRNVYLLTP